MLKFSKLLFLSSFLLASYSYAEQITVDATRFPNAEILEVAKPILAKQGYTLKINIYDSYNDPAIATPLTGRFGPKNPNSELSNKKCDANFFQHVPYLDQYNQMFENNLVNVGSVFYVPFAVYLSKNKSEQYSKTHDLAKVLSGARVAIPDSAINETRSIKLLSMNNILKFKQSNPAPGLDDVESNPYGVVIYKVDGNVIPQMLTNRDIDVAVMNAGNASMLGLKLDHATFVESGIATYANILVSRKDNANSAKIKALKNALQSPEVKQYMQHKYGNLLVPAF